MNRYIIAIKDGKNKKRIVEQGFAESKKAMFEKYKQELIERKLYLEIDGIVYIKNYYIKEM